MVHNTIFVKLGGSTITDIRTPQKAKLGEIKRLLREIVEAKGIRNFNLIIGHGSGSFGHAPSKRYKINELKLTPTKERIGPIITEQETSQLNRLFVAVALQNNIPVFPFSTHSLGTASNFEFNISYVKHIRTAINLGFIPLLYGDIVIDSVRGISDLSTEEILRSLSRLIRPDIVIVGTDVDGLFTRDPKLYGEAKLIKLVTSKNFSEVLEYAGNSTKIDSTGGMKTKVRSLYNLVRTTGAVGYIVNATKKGILRSALLGEEIDCTVVRSD